MNQTCHLTVGSWDAGSDVLSGVPDPVYPSCRGIRCAIWYAGYDVESGTLDQMCNPGPVIRCAICNPESDVYLEP